MLTNQPNFTTDCINVKFFFFFLWVYIDFGIYVCEGNLDISAAAHDRGDFGAAVEDGEEEEMVFGALELVLSTLLQVVDIM